MITFITAKEKKSFLNFVMSGSAFMPVKKVSSKRVEVIFLLRIEKDK